MAGSIRDGSGHRAYRRKQKALKRRTAAQGLICTWCGAPIDTSLPAKDRWSFSADHPEALKNGGDLVKQELEPMHRRCNAAKKDSEPVEIWEAS